MKRNGLRKIVLLGSTGSGKTTFLRNLVGDMNFDDSAEVERNITQEEEQILNTFTIVDREMYENSTTTVSINAQTVLFTISKTNKFGFFPVSRANMPALPRDEIDSIFPTLIIDTAGQERFSFMQEIGLKGADGVIIFADGSNVQSIERISHFYQMVKEEEGRTDRKIPIVVFINKKDLEGKGLFIGLESVSRWIPELEIDTHATSNFDLESFYLPIRNFLNAIDGFPLSMSEVKMKATAST